MNCSASSWRSLTTISMMIPTVTICKVRAFNPWLGFIVTLKVWRALWLNNAEFCARPEIEDLQEWGVMIWCLWHIEIHVWNDEVETVPREINLRCSAASYSEFWDVSVQSHIPINQVFQSMVYCLHRYILGFSFLVLQKREGTASFAPNGGSYESRYDFKSPNDVYSWLRSLTRHAQCLHLDPFAYHIHFNFKFIMNWNLEIHKENRIACSGTWNHACMQQSSCCFKSYFQADVSWFCGALIVSILMSRYTCKTFQALIGWVPS